MTTIVDVIRADAERYAEETACSFLREDGTEEPVSRAQLWLRVVSAAAAVREVAAPGDRVLVAFPPGPDFNVGLLACFHAGVVAVPIQPPSASQRVDRIDSVIQDCEPVAALGTTAAAQIAARGSAALQRVRWIDPRAEQPAAAREPRRAEIALLQYTSGSTGQPKGVVLTHENVMSNIATIASMFRTTPDDRAVFWLPPYHDMGLIGGILASLVTRVTTTFMSPTAFVRRPLQWLAAISRVRATISGGPNFAYALCAARATDADVAALDLRTWRIAFCGAEPIDPASLAAFSERFAVCGFAANALYPCYGLAESTLMVTGVNPGDGVCTTIVDAHALEHDHAAIPARAGTRTRELVRCGIPAPRHAVRIVEPETEAALTECAVGEVWIEGPSVGVGYWNRPEESRRVFEARLNDSPGKRYLRTGDLGFLENGELVITGRIKEMIIVAGRNLYPDDLERAARRSDALLADSRAAAFGTAEGVVMVHEVDQPAAVEEHERARRAVTRALFDEYGVGARVVLVRRRAIPLTTSGKVRRGECRRLFVERELQEVGL
jgi:acyl-CoA synthetase (AMP-forming)/AMP-acid ligase II